MCLSRPVLAQGTVIFNNGPAGLVRWGYAPGGDIGEYPPVEPGNLDGYVQLAYAPAGTAAGMRRYDEGVEEWVATNPGWTLGPKSTFNLPNEPGMFDGGVVSLDGVPAGAEASYAVFAYVSGMDWSGHYVTGYFIGLSTVFTTRTGADAASAVPLADTFGGVLAVPRTLLIPEPGALSLVSLGAAVILLSRRRGVGRTRPQVLRSERHGQVLQ